MSDFCHCPTNLRNDWAQVVVNPTTIWSWPQWPLMIKWNSNTTNVISSLQNLITISVYIRNAFYIITVMSVLSLISAGTCICTFCTCISFCELAEYEMFAIVDYILSFWNIPIFTSNSGPSWSWSYCSRSVVFSK